MVLYYVKNVLLHKIILSCQIMIKLVRGKTNKEEMRRRGGERKGRKREDRKERKDRGRWREEGGVVGREGEVKRKKR